MVEQINWVEDDKRVGRKDTPVGTQWPELDVFGNPYSQPASTVVNDLNPSFFVVIPSREIKPDEWAAIRDAFSTTAPPVPAADPMPTPNDSDSADKFAGNFSGNPEDTLIQAPDQPTPVELAAPDEGGTSDRAPDAGNVNELPRRSKFK